MFYETAMADFSGGLRLYYYIASPPPKSLPCYFPTTVISFDPFMADSVADFVFFVCVSRISYRRTIDAFQIATRQRSSSSCATKRLISERRRTRQERPETKKGTQKKSVSVVTLAKQDTEMSLLFCQIAQLRRCDIIN